MNTEKSNSLRACPFCGQTNISIEYDGIYRWAECRNTKCETTGKIHAFLVDAGNTEYLVAKEWNTRPIEDALQSEIARLTEENAKWKHLVEMKNDALDSYAEFYNQCLAICNMDVDTNPCTEADERILETLRKGAKDE